MALTAAQINQIAIILGVGKSVINAQITSLGTDFTAQDETDVETELAAWTAAKAAGGALVKIHPMESNYGAETLQGTDYDEIKTNIAVLLQFENLSVSGMGTLSIGL
jgi:hypothetical protein